MSVSKSATATAASAAMVTIIVVLSAAIGFYFGQRTACFDFFGIAKSCTLITR